MFWPHGKLVPPVVADGPKALLDSADAMTVFNVAFPTSYTGDDKDLLSLSPAVLDIPSSIPTAVLSILENSNDADCHTTSRDNVHHPSSLNLFAVYRARRWIDSESKATLG